MARRGVGWPPRSLLAGPRRRRRPDAGAGTAARRRRRRRGPRLAVAAVAGSAIAAGGCGSPAAAGIRRQAVAVGRAAVATRVRSASGPMAREPRPRPSRSPYALAGELRAGRTPAQALAAVADLAGPLAPALRRPRRGRRRRRPRRTSSARGRGDARRRAAALVAAAWAVAERAGGRVAVVLERLCESHGQRAPSSARSSTPRWPGRGRRWRCWPGCRCWVSRSARPSALTRCELLLHRPLGWGLLAARGAARCRSAWS